MIKALALADFLMRLTAFTAPRARTAWVRAMTSEYLSLPEGSRRLSWAAGCVATSLGWRGRQELNYVLVLASLPLLWNAALSPLAVGIANVLPTPDLSARALSALYLGGIAVIALLLSAYWPQRAAFTIAAVWLLTVGAVTTGTLGLLQLADFNGAGAAFEPSLTTIIVVLGSTLWPGVLAGAAGWSMARGRSALAVVSCSLVAVYLVMATFSPAFGALQIAATISVFSLAAALAVSLVRAIVQVRAAWRTQEPQ